MGTKKRKYNKKNNSKKKKTIVGGEPPEDDVSTISLIEGGIIFKFSAFNDIIKDYDSKKKNILDELEKIKGSLGSNNDPNDTYTNIKTSIEKAIIDINSDKNVTITNKDGNTHTIDDLKKTLTEVQAIIQDDPSIKKITFFQTLIKNKKINENYEIDNIDDLNLGSDSDIPFYDDDNDTKKIKKEDMSIVDILKNYYDSLGDKKEFDQRKIFTTLEKALKKNDTDTVEKLNELISKFSQINGEVIEEIKDSTNQQLQDDIKEINENIDQINEKKRTVADVIKELQDKNNTNILEKIKNLNDLTYKYQDMANEYIKQCQTYQDKYDEIVHMYEQVKDENRELLKTQMETYQTIISTTNYDNVDTYIKMFLISDENMGRFNQIFEKYMEEEKQEEKQENPVYSDEIDSLIGMLTKSHPKYFEIVQPSSPDASISSESKYSEII